ncbi:hypothetical protein TRFO_14957 [Tritrichomonas foetus]|uniref:RING-type domain-containing protein n=1 Tax=Tritrichomonas foetus TaxID=1144522 RepID=A0A1J4KU39_9EUKA|nr:hypothetical protein TRFO_14957 [Tritrichomonas foetus]|eukprot:OHT14650.1 hypothetical protein TRFO_14957 [Tritrichomonas foetus]
MTADTDSKLIELISCPVCYLVMSGPGRLPMVFKSCGHTVCSECLPALSKCPLCNKKSEGSIENYSLISLVEHAHKTMKIDPEIDPPSSMPVTVCTFVNGDPDKEQRFYHCRTCGITDRDVICEACVRICHAGHNTSFYKITKGYCDCGSMGCDVECKCINDKNAGKCTIRIHGKNYVRQRWYHCKTCFLTGDLGCCQSCARICHKNHNVIFAGICESCYCDCGSGNKNCLCMKSNIKK